MSNFEFRKLMLSAVGAAFVFSPLASESYAEDVERTVTAQQAAWTVKIGTQKSESVEATGIVISPSRQVASQSASGEPEAPILVAPDYDEEPAEKSSEKKTGEKPTRGSSKKAEKSSVATETASQKAREEWQKQKQKKEPADGVKHQPKGKDSTEKNTEKAKKTKSEKNNRKLADDSRSKAAASKAAQAEQDARKRAMAAREKAKAIANSAQAKSMPAASSAGARAQEMFAKRAASMKDSRSYREIYNSIPFSRTEYDANPGYRHLATMEIMLGQLHPIIVASPAPPRQETKREITVRFLPAIRPGYRPYSQYPWH